MLLRVLSTIFWAFMVVSSALLYPIAVLIWLLTVAFDKRLVILHQFTCFWGSIYTYLNPAWRVTIEGREKIRRGAAYVMVANHQSFLDILVLFRLFTHFKWVSKIENFKVPFVGWNMSLNRYIKLRRGDPNSIAEMMTDARRTILEGNPIMMFPEGTRSEDGKLKAFKHGAFTLAQETRSPILPIVLHGTSDALPKRGYVLKGRHAIHVKVLDEIPFEQFANLSVDEVTDQVRTIIARELGQAERDEIAARPRATATG